jgi:hypothetical protein
MAAHLVPGSVATLAEKQAHLLARGDPKAQDVDVDAHDDVLWHERHEGKSGGGAKQRAPHGGEHVGAGGLEDAEDAVCGAQCEKRRGEDKPFHDLRELA